MFCFSNAGKDNHTDGVVYFGVSVVSSNGHLLFKTESQISKRPRSSEKFRVSAYIIIYYYYRVRCLYYILRTNVGNTTYFIDFYFRKCVPI